MEVQELWNIPWLPWQHVNSFFSSPQTSLPYFVLSFSFQFNVLIFKRGKRKERRREGKVWPPPFSLCKWSGSSCRLCSGLCRWHSLWPCAKLHRSKCNCAGNFCLHLCAPVASDGVVWAESGWAKKFKDLCKSLKMRTKWFKARNII